MKLATLADVLTEEEIKSPHFMLYTNTSVRLCDLTTRHLFDLFAVIKWQTKSVTSVNAVIEVWQVLTFRAINKGKQIF
jgi:hypothetical protein